MIVRRPLICNACEKKTVTRTRVGYDGVYHYSFPCPGCGIQITFTIKIDSKTISAEHCDLVNARWTESVDGAIKAIMFESDMPVPAGLPDRLSPWVAQAFNFRDLEAFNQDEGLRRYWIERGWPTFENLAVHFEKGNDALFDKTAGFDDGPHTRTDRLARLGEMCERAFNFFTTDTPADRARIAQRLALASSIAPALVDEFAEEYIKTGRMASLWNEIKNVRREFVMVYPALAPLVQVDYWHERYRDLSVLTLSVKRFDDLKHLFVDCFETLCRLLVIAVAIEAIIFHGELAIPAKKRKLTIWEFEALENANKRDFIRRYPIADLFLPVMDTTLRNGIGHHSARYDGERDEVIYYRVKGGNTVEQRLPYTRFCDLCRRVFSAFELAVIYFHFLHLRVSGRL